MGPQIEGQPVADPPQRPYVRLKSASASLVHQKSGEIMVTMCDRFGEPVRQLISPHDTQLLLEWLCMVSVGNGSVSEVEEFVDSDGPEVGGKYSTRRVWKVGATYTRMP